MSESPVAALEAAVAASSGSDSLPRFALGISGGSDSMALLAAAVELRDSGSVWPEVWVLHVDHGLRPESADTARAVLELAQELGFPVDERRIQALVPQSGSLEAWAREHRYALVAEMMQARGLQVFLTAHHRDDQAETVGLSLMRGAGVLGLGGMPEERPLGRSGARLRRPFLGLSRETLSAYRLARGLPEFVDRSNAALVHRRNLLRHVGALSDASLRPAGLLDFARRVRALRERFEVFCDDLLKRGSLVVERRFARQSAEVQMAGFGDYPMDLQRHIVLRLLWAIDRPALLPSFAALATLKQRAGAVELARDTWIYWVAGQLRVWTEDSGRRFEPRILVVDGATEVVPDLGRFRARSLTAQAPSMAQENQDLPRAQVRGALVLRSPRLGEKMQPLGMAGRKTVADLLREAGVEPIHRWSWPVVADDEGILWLVGIRAAERARLGADREARLRLEFERG